jgi:hypothetical protein
MSIILPPTDDIPQDTLGVMTFAQSIARSYATRGGDSTEVTAVLAGLIATRDSKLAAESLTALDNAVAGK